MPPEPHAGSNTLPPCGSIISTIRRTTDRGVKNSSIAFIASLSAFAMFLLLREIQEVVVTCVVRKIKPALLDRDIRDLLPATCAFALLILRDNIGLMPTIVVVGNFRKISPSTGVAYSLDFRSELARRLSAALQSSASSRLSCSFVIYAQASKHSDPQMICA